MKEFGLDEAVLTEDELVKRRLRLKTLIKLGYFKGVADGQMTAILRLAVQDYQRDKNLPATGQLDLATANSLSTYNR